MPISLNKADYVLEEEIGQGVSAKVWRAKCIPTGEELAVKELDLEFCQSSLEEIRNETILMSQMKHPNVVPYHGSFVNDRYLWVLMPYMGGGSCAHLMKWAHPSGFDEVTIATIMKEVLKALDYLHKQGNIHRDIKAGNILLDDAGRVLLGDFGVSACMFSTGDRTRGPTRTTFVGTPCWMAPEVVQNQNTTTKYDQQADMWSVGITMLELAHGHAPFARFEPLKVLQMILRAEPPTLEGADSDNKSFSKAMREVVAMCLQKDPLQRPTASKLKDHRFFKQVPPKGAEYLQKRLLNPEITQGLDLAARVRALKERENRSLRLHHPNMMELQRSSDEQYKHGIALWNFKVDPETFRDDNAASESSAVSAAAPGASTAGLSATGADDRGASSVGVAPLRGDAAIAAAAAAAVAETMTMPTAGVMAPAGPASPKGSKQQRGRFAIINEEEEAAGGRAGGGGGGKTRARVIGGGSRSASGEEDNGDGGAAVGGGEEEIGGAGVRKLGRFSVVDGDGDEGGGLRGDHANAGVGMARSVSLSVLNSRANGGYGTDSGVESGGGGGGGHGGGQQGSGQQGGGHGGTGGQGGQPSRFPRVNTVPLLEPGGGRFPLETPAGAAVLSELTALMERMRTQQEVLVGVVSSLTSLVTGDKPRGAELPVGRTELAQAAEKAAAEVLTRVQCLVKENARLRRRNTTLERQINAREAERLEEEERLRDAEESMSGN